MTIISKPSPQTCHCEQYQWLLGRDGGGRDLPGKGPCEDLYGREEWSEGVHLQLRGGVHIRDNSKTTQDEFTAQTSESGSLMPSEEDSAIIISLTFKSNDKFTTQGEMILINAIKANVMTETGVKTSVLLDASPQEIEDNQYQNMIWSNFITTENQTVWQNLKPILIVKCFL